MDSYGGIQIDSNRLTRLNTWNEIVPGDNLTCFAINASLLRSLNYYVL